jgi:hypothetical protein
MNLDRRLERLEQAAEDAPPLAANVITVDTVLGVLAIPDYALPTLLKVYGDAPEMKAIES